MPDDDRTRRRLGDETKARIADLASGWTVESPESAPASAPTTAGTPAGPTPAVAPNAAATAATPNAATPAVAPDPAPPEPGRKKPRTVPPPPPGSAERKALENKILETKLDPELDTKPEPALAPPTPAANPRTKSPSAAPPAKPSSTPAPTAVPATKSTRTPAPSAPAPRSNPPTAPPPARAKAPTTPPPSSVPRAAAPSSSVPRAAAPSSSGPTAAPRTSPPTTPPPSSGPVPRPAAPAPSGPRTSPPTAPPPARAKAPTAPPPPPGGKAASKSGPASAIGAEPSRKVGSKSGPAAAIGAEPSARVGGRTGAQPSLVGPPPAPLASLDPNAPAPPIAGFASAKRAAELAPTLLPVPDVVPPPDQRLAVPIGEFDSGVQTIDDDKLRRERDQPTLVRDPAEALLKIPDQVVPIDSLLDESPESIKSDLAEAAGSMRGDPTSIDPNTRPFERGDPTAVGEGRGDATEIQGPNASQLRAGGKLRATAALRRKRGVVGDVFYVFTALGGMRRAKRELTELEHRREVRTTSRRRHLVTLGRTAIVSEGFDHPALGKAREALAAVEDERSQHAGAVAASNAELERVGRDRAANNKKFVEDKTTVEAELADLAKKLVPLEKEASTAKKKAAELRDALAGIEKKLADTEGLLVSVKGEKMDKAQIHADIATLKADRKAVRKDEPVIAAELDALNPRIAAIEAARTEAEKRKKALEDGEALDQKRTAELLEALGAKRKVVERAAAEATDARDKVLFDLGDRLYVDRPILLGAQLAPIDEIDLELGEDDRRIMELREILSNIDKWKLARGIAVIVGVLAVVGGFVGWLIYRLA